MFENIKSMDRFDVRKLAPKEVETLRFYHYTGRPKHDPLGFIGYTDMNDCHWVLHKITEERHTLSDGYKVTLTPLDEKQGFPSHIYQMDFNHMVQEGRILIADEGTRVEHVVAMQKVAGFDIYTEADIVVSA